MSNAFYSSCLRVVACFGLVIGASQVQAAQLEHLLNDSNDKFEQYQDEAGQALQLVGTLRPSFYWIAMETKDGLPKTHKLLDGQGALIAKISENFYKKLAMEGTGHLLDGRVINFKSRIKNPDGTSQIFWRVCGADAPAGYGIGEIPLSPFRSVAVDPSVIPLGSRVYIPAAKGAVLPDGSIHDGYFAAVDIGDLIQEKKIDIFTWFGDQEKYFEKVGMETGKLVDVYLVR